MKNFTKFLGMENNSKTRLLLVMLGMIWSISSWGADRYAVATGNWNSTSTWSTSRGGASGASVPVAGDVVYIDAHTVTVTATAECSSVTFDQTTGTLTVNTGITLTVSGQILSSITGSTKTATLAGAGTISCGSIAVGSNVALSVNANVTNTLKTTITNLTCSGDISVNGDYNSTYKYSSLFSIEGGTVTCNNISLYTDGNVTVDAQIKNTTGFSTLKIAGTISTSENGASGTQTITLNDADSYVEYNGSASTVYPTSYPNFRISNTSGTVTLGGNINVAGDWDNDGTFSASTYNVTFNGGANQSILGDNSTTFNKIYVNNPGYTVTLIRNVTCSELNFNNTASSQTATFSVSTGVTLTINGSLTKTSVISTTYAVLTGLGTVNCTSINIGTAGTGGASVDAQNYFTSTISTLSSTGDLTILGYCSGSYDIRTYCYFNSGTIQVANVLLNISAGGSCTTNVELRNDQGAASSLLKISGANSITTSGSGNIAIALNGSSSTVEYNGTSAQNVYTTTYNNLKINNSHASGCSLTGALSTASLDITQGILTTTSTNLLSVTGTSNSAISRTAGYVNGPLKWTIATGATCGGSAYVFPVGKNGGYYPFTLSNYTATNPQSPTVEVFSTGANGTPPAAGTLLSNSEYWKVIYSNNAMTCATVKLERPTDLASNKNIYYSTTANGTYTSMGSSASTAKSSTSTSTSITYTNATHFYVVGGASCSTYSGTKTIGASGDDFTSLTDAMISLNSCGYTGNIVLELQSDYDGTSSTETFPITIPSTFASVASSSSRTITIRPASGVSKSISGSKSGGAIIYLNGADYIEIDGNGSDNTGSLIIENTAAAAASNRAILLDNNASNNTIKNCTLESNNSSVTNSTAGVVFLGSGDSGNNTNTFDNNTVTYQTGTSTKCLFVSYNSTGTNSSNTISNSSFVDFEERGVWLSTGSDQFTISGNNIYRSASVTGGATVGLIYIEVGNQYTINGNYLGSTTVNCGSGSGAYLTTSGTFYGLYLAGAGSSTSNIYGNFIKYIASSSNTTVYGVYINKSSLTINMYENEISNIYISNSGTGSSNIVHGCYFTGTSFNLNFYKNKVTDIYSAASGSSTYYYSCSFYQTTTSTINCYNNYIDCGKAANSSRTYALRTSASTAYILNNTIDVKTTSNGGFDTYNLYAITASTTTYIYNNILTNSGSNSTAAKAALLFKSTNTINHDYNFYQNSGATSACVTDGTTNTTFTNWEGSSGSGGQTHGQTFSSTNYLTLYSNGVVNAYNTYVNGNGKNLYSANAVGSSPAITTDLINRSRPNSAMWIGCYEGSGNIYYSTTSDANTDASTTSNWKTSRNNTGTSPGSFTTTGDIFIIQPGHKYQVTNTAAFTGTSTGYVQVESGGALDINAQTMNGWQYLKIAGTGVSLSGAFYNSSSSAASISVPINLTAAATIKSTGTGGLTLSGAIDNGGYTLTMDGSNASAISGSISGAGDFVKTGAGTLSFNGAGSLTFTNLTINSGKINGQKDITVNGVLNLGPNPNDTDGALDMVIDYGNYALTASADNSDANNNLNSKILSLGSAATVIGSGDVTGKVRRGPFTNGVSYAFGNAKMTLTFDNSNGGDLPTQITVVSTRGRKGLHVDKDGTNDYEPGRELIGPAAVKRLWQILKTGGSSPTRFTVKYPYEIGELNGNTDSNLVTWDHHLDSPTPYAGITPHEHGKTRIDTNEQIVELAGHSIMYLTNEVYTGPDKRTKYWMLSDKVTTDIMWIGASGSDAATNWTAPSNWTSGAIPTQDTDIVIPSFGIYKSELNLQSNYDAKTIEIKPNAIMHGGGGTLTLHGGPAINGGRGTWINNGTFDAGTGTVVFNYTDATLAGSTTFNNFTVNSGKKVTIQGNTTATINGTITNNSSSAIETLATSTFKVNNFSLTDNFTFTNNGTLEVLGTLTDSRNEKNYGGLVRYAATTGSQSIIGGSYNHLDLTAAATKSFSSDPTVAGDFTIAGGTVTPPALFKFNGASTQNIAGLPYNNIEFSGNGNKTITSNASVSATSAITFGSGSGAVDFDGDDTKTFVLKSEAGGTARVGNVGGFTLTGKVTAERYMPARRAWRFITAPLKGGSNNSIASNWRGNNGEGLLLFSPATYLGQTMTGYTLGGGSPNILKFSNGAWVGIPDITATNTLFNETNNEPYLVFAVGPTDSQNITSSTGASVTTLRPKGNLITGNVQHSLTANTSKLISNPYASPIDPESLLVSNNTSKIWLLDPTLGLGGYVTYDGLIWSTPIAAEDKYIQSGQGFFVRATEGTTFTIQEAHKVSGNTNNWFNRTSVQNQSNDADKIRALLYKQENGEWKLADGIVTVNSANGNNEVDNKDANKISNFNENIMFRNGTRNLSIEYRALPQPGSVQPMYLTATTAIPYQLRLFTENYSNSNLVPFLQNTQNGNLTEIPIDGSVITIPFTGVASTSANPDMRFRIVYQTSLSNNDAEILQVGVYPNPVENGIFNVNLKDNTSPANYTITNMLGQEVQTGKLANIQNTIQVKNAAQGVYLLKINQEDKVFTTKLYIK